MKSRMVLWILLFSVLLALPAAAVEGLLSPAGVVKVLSGTVVLERNQQRIQALVGSMVMPGDLVTTGDGSSVGITLRDNTLLTAGPNSSLSLKEFVYNPSTQAGSLDATLNCGTLAVVSGTIAKRSPQAVRLSTPVTLIGVRGTEFLVQAKCQE